jgi:prepilin-type N-terminal cleavage/methylation domain-containing protein
VTKLPRRPRFRHEEGFTLIELLIAMIVLTVGILALVAAYSSGYAALNRATRVSSARLSAIKLNTTCGASCTEDATFTGDSTYSSAAQVTGCTTTDSTCLPTQTKTGPDGKTYRLDSYVEYACVSGTLVTSPSLTCGSGNPQPVKRVTVVVRSSALTAPVREQSTFAFFPSN